MCVTHAYMIYSYVIIFFLFSAPLNKIQGNFLYISRFFPYPLSIYISRLFIYYINLYTLKKQYIKLGNIFKLNIYTCIYRKIHCSKSELIINGCSKRSKRNALAYSGKSLAKAYQINRLCSPRSVFSLLRC